MSGFRRVPRVGAQALSFAMLLAVVGPAGCGGGSGDDDDDDAPVVDAGPPDAPVATSLTARGVFDGAIATARQFHDDAVLFELTSGLISGGGEVNPAVNQSYWSFAFASLSTGVRINILFSGGVYNSSLSTVNPEGLKTLPEPWLDSDDAMTAMASFGFQPPGPSDTFSQISMKLTPGSVIEQCAADPQWSVDKITAPPGETVETEHWLVIECTGVGRVVCDPGGNCDLAP
jgi:hypothetical protein